jgi:hypothetical protein
MRRAIARLIVLITLLIMPFGMTPAPTAAGRIEAAASMPTPHCPHQDPSHAAKGGIAICGMACSAALPAADANHETPTLAGSVPIEQPIAHGLTGIQPETATPPPRRS